MEINVVKLDPDYTHVALSGRLDLDGIDGLDKEYSDLLVERQKPVIVDLSKVDYMASIGLRMLITAAKPLSEHGAKTVLLNPKPDVEEVLRTSGFHRIMPIEHDLGSALDVLKNES